MTPSRTSPLNRTRRDTLAVTAIGLLPLLELGVGAALGKLSPNPIEDVTHVTGEWALRFLVATLAITPLRRFSGWSRLAPQRRTFGLLAFTYAALHGATWALLDQGLHWPSIREDLVERPFVWLGATALLSLLPLAVTSTREWMKRLGRRWRLLHRLVWVAIAAAIVHFYMGTLKAGGVQPFVWGVIALALFALRFWPLQRTPERDPSTASPSS